MKVKTFKITITENKKDGTTSLKTKQKNINDFELIGLLRSRLQFLEYLILQQDINS